MLALSFEIVDTPHAEVVVSDALDAVDWRHVAVSDDYLIERHKQLLPLAARDGQTTVWR